MGYQPCKFLDVPTGKRIMKNDLFTCKYVVPEMVLPISITTAYGYSRDQRRCCIGKDDCAVCPCFTKKDATHD